MHQIITSGNMTMTSREIADLVESRHDSVKRTIERLAQSCVISQPPLVDGGKAANGTIEKVYVFAGDQGKRDSIIVVAQLSPEFTARLVDRWSELESKITHLPMNPAQMSRMQLLQLAMQAEEERLQLEHQVDELKPRAAVAERISLSFGSLSLTDAAKSLGMQPQKQFIPWLSAHRWIYKRAGGSHWIAYQDKIQQGLLEHKTETRTMADGSDKIVEQVKVTGKGLTRLADIFNVAAEFGFDQAA